MIGDKPTNIDPVQKLRAALHDKAKSAPSFRFYALYDKVYRRDVLEAAYAQCRANGGAPGVDNQTFEDIEKYGVATWLDELTETFGRMYSPRTGGAYIGAKPSHKKVLGVCRQLNELVGKIPTFIRPEVMVYRVNQVLRGWAGYFGYGTYSPAFALVHEHITYRVRRWLCRKFDVKGKGYRQFPDGYLERKLGLLNLTRFQPSDSWTKP